MATPTGGAVSTLAVGGSSRRADCIAPNVVACISDVRSATSSFNFLFYKSF